MTNEEITALTNLALALSKAIETTTDGDTRAKLSAFGEETIRPIMAEVYKP